jgi:hypothetical protein
MCSVDFWNVEGTQETVAIPSEFTGLGPPLVTLSPEDGDTFSPRNVGL